MHPYQPSSASLAQATERTGRDRVYAGLAGLSTALIVVDMQNYYCRPGFLGETPVALTIVPAIERMAAATRAAGGLVVWVQTSSADVPARWDHFHRIMMSPARRERRIAGLRPDGEGFALLDGLHPQEGDSRVIKTTYSAFGPASPDLNALLRGRGIDTLLIAGTLTNVCCETTARDGCVLDYGVVMLSDANAARTDAVHAATLDNFRIFFGEVMTVDETIARLPVKEAAE